MAKLTQKQIRDLARSLVGETPGGIRYSALVDTIAKRSPETPRNTIHGSVWDLASRFPDEISKPSRGLFTPTNTEQKPVASALPDKTPGAPSEEEFYASFAEFLQNDLDEATEAEALGGSGLKSKWGTPDVVGVYRPRAADMIKFTHEVISAEIKVDGRSAIEAFGQAIAYRLFSTKSYIVMPTTISEEDKSRLEALCTLFGVGLVLFTPDPARPVFSIRAKAQRFSPDMFYVNEFADRLKQHKHDVFEKLFG